MMLEGMPSLAAFPHDPTRLRYVAFLTDGYIGNEAESSAEMQLARRRPGLQLRRRAVHQPLPARPHGQAWAAARPRTLAATTRPKTSWPPYFDRISHPALTDTPIDWGG